MYILSILYIARHFSPCQRTFWSLPMTSLSCAILASLEVSTLITDDTPIMSPPDGKCLSNPCMTQVESSVIPTISSLYFTHPHYQFTSGIAVPNCFWVRTTAVRSTFGLLDAFSVKWPMDSRFSRGTAKSTRFIPFRKSLGLSRRSRWEAPLLLHLTYATVIGSIVWIMIS